MSNFKFFDKITDNYIEFRIDGNCAWIERYYVDNDNGKMFIMLLKESFLEMKKKGCSCHMQYVSAEEWDKSIKNVEGWEIVSVDSSNIMLIKCDIDIAPICIADGLMN